MGKDFPDTGSGWAFIARYFGAAFVLSVLAALLFFGYSFRLRRQLDEAWRAQLKARASLGSILLLDETLTMSALMAAAGGGPEYEGRYDQAALELDKLLEETARLLPEGAPRAALADTAAANERLARMERGAFVLARQGRRAEAAALLKSEEYQVWKTASADGIKKLARLTAAAGGAAGESPGKFFRRELLAGAGGILLAALPWLLSVVVFRRYALGSGAAALLPRETEDDYRRFFDNVDEIFYCTSLRGVIKKVTPSVYRLAGYRPEEVLGRPVQEIYENPADRAKLLKELLTKGAVTNYVVRLKTRNRGVVYAAVNARLTRGFGGLPVGVEGSLRDVTRMKLAEEALEQRTEQMEALVQNAPSAIIPVDRNGRVLMWNKAAEKMFGWSAAEVAGKPDPTVPEQKKEEFRSLFGRLLCWVPVYDMETQRLRKDGTLADVSVSVIPMRGRSGEMESVMSFITDITARKRLEASLRECRSGSPDQRGRGGT